MLLLMMALVSGICQAAFYGVSRKEVMYGLGDGAKLVLKSATGFVRAPLRRRGLSPHSVVERHD
jgi:hypothetical protein